MNYIVSIGAILCGLYVIVSVGVWLGTGKDSQGIIDLLLATAAIILSLCSILAGFKTWPS